MCRRLRILREMYLNLGPHSVISKDIKISRLLKVKLMIIGDCPELQKGAFYNQIGCLNSLNDQHTRESKIRCPSSPYKSKCSILSEMFMRNNDFFSYIVKWQIFVWILSMPLSNLYITYLVCWLKLKVLWVSFIYDAFLFI